MFLAEVSIGKGHVQICKQRQALSCSLKISSVLILEIYCLLFEKVFMTAKRKMTIDEYYLHQLQQSVNCPKETTQNLSRDGLNQVYLSIMKFRNNFLKRIFS